MIKLIAIDMDGTLLDSQKQIPQANIDVLKEAREAGVKIVLCTGRVKSGVLPYAEELDLSGKDEYAILDNGCTTYSTKDWSLLNYHQLQASEIEDLVARVANYPDVDVTFFDQSHYFIVSDQVPELVAYDAGLVFNTVTPTTVTALKASEAPILQGMYMGEVAALDRFEVENDAELRQQFSMVRSQSYIYEVLPKGTTKASALIQLAQDLGISPDEVMAIGDAANDIEMLEFAGISIAMGNASEAVKALADDITSSHDEAGVAQAIRKWVLN